MVDPYLEEQILGFLMSSMYRTQSELIPYILNKKNSIYTLSDVIHAIRELSKENKIHREVLDSRNIYLIKISDELREHYVAVIQQHNSSLGRTLRKLIGVKVPNSRSVEDMRLNKHSRGHPNKHAKQHGQRKREVSKKYGRG